MNFPRKRAAIACNFCRHRKRKCDGKRPTCAACNEVGAICDYQDNATAADNSTTNNNSNNVANNEADKSELLGRINKLEELVKELGEKASATPVMLQQPHPIDDQTLLTSFNLNFPVPSNPSSPAFASQLSHQAETSAGPGVRTDPALPYPLDNQDQPMTIPIGHLTTTGSLFSIQQIKSLIGEYPDDFFFQIESTRNLEPEPLTESLPELLALVASDSHRAEALVASFFSEIHPHFPIIEQKSFTASFRDIIGGVTGDGVDAALCFIVLALGELATTMHSPDTHEQEEPGRAYFSAAYHILTSKWLTSFDMETTLVSGLVYAGIYLSYVARPLQAWRLIHMASTKLQLIVSQAKLQGVSEEDSDCICRLCWTCFLLECDSLAEFHLPRSGIELVIETMPFPYFNNDTDTRGISFLAICSVRRLLNRIHHTIYATGCTASASAISASSPATHRSDSSAHPTRPANINSVCIELARQLDAWYYSLPDSIRPEMANNRPQHLQEGWLRLRYWSAKHIIYRPCLLWVASSDDASELPSYALEYSAMCIQACRNYVDTAACVLSQRTQYTWMTIQASLSCSFVLTIAARSPLLRHLVLDINDLLRKAKGPIQEIATPGSSAESIGWMLNTIVQKQRLPGWIYKRRI